MEDFLDTAMLFLGSLLAPAVMLTGYARPPVEEWVPGWTMFLYGPLGVLDGQVGWFANPLMLAAVLHGSSPVIVRTPSSRKTI